MTALWHFFRRLLICLFLIVGTFIIGVLYYMEYELPNIDELNTVQLQVPLRIYTHDGKLIGEYGEKRRIPVPYDQIPKPLIDAVLATEDQRYFAHPGIDIPGLLRAAVQLVITGRKDQGGSTITMQVARSFYLTRHKTFGRKLREILLALKIDHKLNKQKILELYLNKIFLGNRAYGVGAAAEVYYGKDLKDLTLDQYAMLAGLPKAPSTLNPLADEDAAKKRRDHVLARLYELHYIDEKAYQDAIKAPLNARYHAPQIEVQAPYVGELARKQLEQMYGEDVYTNGYKVYTTITSRLQEAANEAVRTQLLAYDERHGYRGPTKNLGIPDIDHLEKWEETLSDTPVVNGLEPVAVVDMTNKTVTVLRASGAMMTIPWKGLSWAHKHIDTDEETGDTGESPQKANDIIGLGDLIYIASTPSGWRLAQIPKAEAGLIALNPINGEILALIGGFDYQHSNFNRITAAERQPGSSFKPFIYSAAFDKGYTLATVINDAPIVIQNPYDNTVWRPQNHEHRFYGPTRLRDAIIHSRNLVSIRLLNLIGTHYAVDYLQRFGFSKAQLPPELSLALGTANVTPLQVATGYAVFANTGFKVDPFIIDHILDREGKTIYQAKPLVACPLCLTPHESDKKNANYAPRVISAQNAFLMTSALHDVIQSGTATKAKSLQRIDLAGKTGTTQDQVDAWFAGYNPDVVAVTWVGFDQPKSLHEYGAQAALPMWIDFMQQALKDSPDHPLFQPPGIVSVRIDPLTGKRTTANDPVARFEYFMSPFVPDEDNNIPGAAPMDENGGIAPAAEEAPPPDREVY